MLRLEELFQDLRLLPGDAAIEFNDTQKINYLLGAEDQLSVGCLAAREGVGWGQFIHYVSSDPGRLHLFVGMQ